MIDTKLSSANGGYIDADGTLPRAHDWNGVIHAEGRFFTDDHGRVLLVRGINLCGNSKLPTISSESILHHRQVSFVGRPFKLDEADEHFKRLRGWGLTFVRLLVTWESLEHKGPGIYDEEYIEYLIKIIRKMSKYGMKCFIANIFSGVDSLADLALQGITWTFEVAGLDITTFQKTGAAHINNVMEPSASKHQFWPTNYAKLACCSMFTLFFGGDTFAPKATYNGETIQNFLQRHFIASFAHLANRLKDCSPVVGFEVINEPHYGYIGLPSIHRFDPLTTLHFGPFPSALQSFALGSGKSLEVDNWVQSWPHPTRKSGKKRLNEEEISAWMDGRSCIWRDHGVWDLDANGNPFTNCPDYFAKHPVTGKKIDFNDDFYLPFIRKYITAIHNVKASYLVFFEPLPNEDPPVFSPSDHSIANLVYAPHWYDLKTLFSKGTKNILAATYFGVSGATTNYQGQIGNIVRNGLERVGTKPILMGECGMPMDINKKKGNLINFTLWNYNPMNDNTYGDYWNGEDFSIYSPKPARSMSTSNSVTSISSLLGPPAVGTSESLPEVPTKPKVGKSKLTDITTDILENALTPTEKSNLEKAPSTEQIPTSPFEITNIYFHDDELALEGDPDHHHHEGGRALDAIVRPYAAKVAGVPIVSKFNLRTLTYTLEFTSNQNTVYSLDANGQIPRSLVTEIFIPNYHFGYANGVVIKVSDGDWKYDMHKQTLYWVIGQRAGPGISEASPLIRNYASKHWIHVSVKDFYPRGIYGFFSWLWNWFTSFFRKQ
ncbi:hypothetical protein HDU97_008083 [Phlyctochytrium planicorne]|nr:hypothetical protein HDU97_008083 [Phlyctochytrium planicorne]